uniref:Uncharacterized protein n=1 Tax=Macaca fascicularis TaxID=9541 RepID=A0A7N9D0P5_MACFA
MAWRKDLGGLLHPLNYNSRASLCRVQRDCSRVHVHNVQVCYICILVPCWCAAPINSSFTIRSKFSSI